MPCCCAPFSPPLSAVHCAPPSANSSSTVLPGRLEESIGAPSSDSCRRVISCPSGEEYCTTHCGFCPSANRAERSIHSSPSAGRATGKGATPSARSALAATSTSEFSSRSRSPSLPTPKNAIPTTTTTAIVSASAHTMLRSTVFFRDGSS